MGTHPTWTGENANELFGPLAARKTGLALSLHARGCARFDLHQEDYRFDELISCILCLEGTLLDPHKQ